MSRSRLVTARKLEQYLYTQTNKATTVTIIAISGSDGNCLFRALAYGLTRDESNHTLLRSYIVSHMTAFEEPFKALFTDDDAYTRHLQKMQKSGEWGTETEIIAAAHLFKCAILCFSKYSSKDLCLQQFSPHFLDSDSQSCSQSCSHQSLYLVNRYGAHYELAVVTLQQQPVMEE